MLDEATSLIDIIRETAIEMLELPPGVASVFSQIASARATGFFLQFDKIPEYLLFKEITYDGTGFIAEWESVSKQAVCPMCGKISESALSSHLFSEKIQDVGIQGKALWHKIGRKKFICTNDHCIQKVFMEGFPGFVDMRRSRMTVEFVQQVLRTAANTSNEAAARILQGQGAVISGDTVIRLVLKHGAQQLERNFYDNAGDVVNVGVDDINLRRGDSSTSCMVVMDLDNGKLLAIARGTTGETAGQVLSMFPNLEIVSRDRATAMASAAKELGLTSVADRYHLAANMHDAIEKTLHETLPKSMYLPIGDSWAYMSNDIEKGELVVAEMPSSLAEDDITLRVRMAHLSAKAELKYRQTLRVLELTLQGKHAQEISDIMGIPIDDARKLRSGMRETVANAEKKIDEYIANPSGSEGQQKSVSRSARHSGKSKVEPYRDTVIAMREEGKSHRAIHEELCKLGFKGSHSTVDNYLIKLGRENSIDKEIADARSAANNYFIPIPDRPERISVRIYSPKTIYERVLARISELRPNAADEERGQDNGTPDHDPSKKKLTCPVK